MRQNYFYPYIPSLVENRYKKTPYWCRELMMDIKRDW
jgi:hypothetical protein